MSKSAKVLYIEDDEMDRRALLRLVREKGLPWELTVAETLAAARAQLATPCFDIIVADYHLPDGDCSELFDEVPDMPFILLTATLEEELALRTLERGADDYLAKDPERRYLEALPFTVEKTLYRKRIHERERRLARQLRESEERFRALVTASSEALYRMSPDWSEMRQLHSGGFLAATERPSRTWLLDYIHPDDQPHLTAAIDEAVRSKSIFQLEHRVRRRDGSLGWMFSRAVPVQDANGEIVEWFGAATDVTARKQAEEKLRQSEEKFRTLAENARASFGIVQGKRFVYANPYFAEVSGYRVDELLSMDFPQLVHPEFQPTMLERARRRQAGESVPNHYEFRMLTKSGDTRWVDFSVGTILYEGKPAIIGSGFDITGYKQAVEALRDSQQQLQELNLHLEQRVAERTAEAEHRTAQLRELASELTRAEQRERSRVAGVLHDHLQQLLVGAKFGASTLRGELIDESHRQALQRVDDLLSESLETSRNLTIELSPPILREGTLAAALQWLAHWMHDKHGLQVHLKADETVDPQDEGTRILIFESVRELLFNIVKHAGTDSACATLERCDGESLRIIVADAGTGFDAGQQSSHDHAAGKFGLFSIRQRLGLIGGRFEIDSTPGQGTRMTLVAPLR